MLNEVNAPKIWDEVNKQLQGEGFGARDLIIKSKVTVVCTTDDPVDDLEYHEKISTLSGFEASIVPGFRPDKSLEINRPTFKAWVDQLSEVSGIAVEHYGQFLEALESRVRYFHARAGRVSDHALDAVMFEPATLEEATEIFAKAIREGTVSESEEKKYKGFTLIFLGKLYSELDWAMQFHIHALRNNNSVMFGRLGPDTGYDAINDGMFAKPLAGLLDALDRENALPKTILYSLNPNDNHVIAGLMGCFQGEVYLGKFNSERHGGSMTIRMACWNR